MADERDEGEVSLAERRQQEREDILRRMLASCDSVTLKAVMMRTGYSRDRARRKLHELGWAPGKVRGDWVKA